MFTFFSNRSTHVPASYVSLNDLHDRKRFSSLITVPNKAQPSLLLIDTLRRAQYS